MLGITEFNCILTCFLISLCGVCRSESDSEEERLDKIRLLFVEGKIDGETYQYYGDAKPKEIHFKNGARIEYTCHHKITPVSGSVQIQWIQEKGPSEKGLQSIFYGNPTETKSKIVMTLYKFDHDSRITCKAYNNVTGGGPFTLLKTFRIPMFHDDTSEDIQPSTNLRLNEGQRLQMACENGNMYAVPPNNSMVINDINRIQKFNFSNEQDGMMFYCVGNIEKTEDKYHITERIITNITILHDKRSESMISAATRSGANYIMIIIIVVVVKVVVVVLLCTFVCIYKKRKRNQEAQTLNLDKHAEPVSVTPHQVIYAELQMAQATRKAKSLEESPYAEIGGVMAPRELNDASTD